MKQIFKCLIVATVLSVLLSSCERILEFADAEEECLMLNVAATPDTILMVSVTRTSPLSSQTRVLEFLDFYDYYKHNDSTYYRSKVPVDAEVTFTVNDGAVTGKLVFDEKSYNFVSDYRPRLGDKIQISAWAEDLFYGKTYTASGSVTVPASVPEFEVVSKEVYYDQKDVDYFDSKGEYDIYGADSIMEIRLSLKDIPNERSYYRLRVRGIAEVSSADKGVASSVTDIFTTSDVLLQDRTLTESFGSWPAYFTDIFDDHLFSNGEYTITVKSRMRSGANPRVLVEYQSITKELYFYLRTVYQYRIHTEDVFYDPISIYTNVDDGWGILGGITSSRVMLYY